jgi:phage-related protein (TIGR01555 family)
MAQDEAPLDSFIGWAGGIIGSSAVEEGLVFLGYPYLSQLALRPEYRFASEIIAGEMTRKWIEFRSVSSSKDKTEKIKDLATLVKDKYHLPDHFYQVLRDDGFFGRAHIYIDAGLDLDDANANKEMIVPIGNGRSDLSKKKVPKGSKLAFKPTEAVWAYPTRYNSNDPLRDDWYQPKTWYVMQREIDRSRFLTIIGRPVPDLLKPAFSFGGLSLSQQMKPYVDNWLRGRQSVSDILHAFTVWVLKTNLGVAIQNAGDDLFRRVEIFDNFRDNHGAAIIDLATEDIANVSAPLGTLDKLQAQCQEHMFSVTRIPGVKFAGLTPTGLNASSEGEIRAFYDTIHDYQERIARNPLTTCINFIQLAEFGEIDEDLTFDFPSLWELDEAAESAVQQTKAATHEFYLTEGVVDTKEVRKSVAADPKSPYSGLDIGETPPPEPAAPEEGEMGPGGEKPHESPNVERMERVAESFGSPETGGFKGDVALDDIKSDE